MSHKSAIAMCSFSHPCRNLRPDWSFDDAENQFALQFSKTYDSIYQRVHPGTPKLHRMFVHEVPVNGLGIADLVTVSWEGKMSSWARDEVPTVDEFLSVQPTVRAFEVKLSDWRRGLMQAHRYKFFADVSILLIPNKKLACVRKYLETFHSLRVGLWAYDEITNRIARIFTPRPKRPSFSSHRKDAISRVLQATI